MPSEKVVIGIPTARPIVREEFLRSLERMSENYGNLVVVFSTSDLEYKQDLEDELGKYHLDYKVIGKEEVEKPSYATNRLWDINQQRRNVRDYFFSTDAQYMLYLDDDVAILDGTAISKFIKIMNEEEVQVLCNAYRRGSTLIAPAYGCVFIRRDALRHIEPRVFRSKSGMMIPEEYFLVMDLISARMRWKSGTFVKNLHLTNIQEDGPFEVRGGEMNELQKSFRSWSFLGLLRGLSFFINYYFCLAELSFGTLRRHLRQLIRRLLG